VLQGCQNIAFNESYLCVIKSPYIYVYSYATGSLLRKLGNSLDNTKLILKDDYFVGIANKSISLWKLDDPLVSQQYSMIYVPVDTEAYSVTFTVNQAFRHIEEKFQAVPVRRVK
jgi:hypothetical protein